MTILLLTLIAIYWYNHPTCYLYEDRWIIGKTADEIIERYGEFDSNTPLLTNGYRGGYLVRRDSTDWWGDHIYPMFYHIYFDENGIAYKVSLKEMGIGG